MYERMCLFMHVPMYDTCVHVETTTTGVGIVTCILADQNFIVPKDTIDEAASTTHPCATTARVAFVVILQIAAISVKRTEFELD